MAVASTPTLLSLDQYAQIVGLEPRHFNQVLCAPFTYNNDDNTWWHQEAWMAVGKLSREELAQGIAQAEWLIAERLGTPVAPTWLAPELHPYPHRHGTPDAGWLAGGYDSYAPLIARPPTLCTAWRPVLALGRRVASVVAEGAAVTYTDADGDGYAERATVTVAGLDTAGWEAAEVWAFPASETDRADHRRIRPLRVTLGAASVSLVGAREQFVRPALWERPATIDGDDDANFEAAVDVVRVTTRADTAAYAAVEYEYLTTSPLQTTTAVGTAVARDLERGIVGIARADWTDGAWQRATHSAWPQRVRLYYCAGIAPDAHGRVPPPYARLVAALATAQVTKPIHSYGPPENLMAYWQSVPERPSLAQRECPWGVLQGAFEAYSTVQRLLAYTPSSL